MSHYYRDVQKFQDKFGFVMPDKFTFLTPDLFSFRYNFLLEEFTEYETAHSEKDLVTAVDSLIDLVYIVCGTGLFHGISNSEFDEIIESSTRNYPLLEELYGGAQAEPFPDEPRLLSTQLYYKLVGTLRHEINAYHNAHKNHWELGLKAALGRIYVVAMAGAAIAGFYPELWDDLWADVQRANMSKVRALKVTDSKRGSVEYDVVKPQGWKAPNGQAIIEKYTGKTLQPQA